jgi:hypothetical protein
MTDATDPQRFTDLGRPRRIWAVAAIHGEAGRLVALHGAIRDAVRPGDRIVYLGNMVGRGAAVRATLDEILAFRREVIARPGMLAEDLVYLRGMQEEMWQKLLQLQFAPNPAEVLQWMLGQGLEETLAAYGGDAREGFSAARGGATAIARWSNTLRSAMRAAPGHEQLMTALRRAAFTAHTSGAPTALLFVNAGVDPTRPLFNQGDRFWWAGGGFTRATEAYEGFERLVRGYDPQREGLFAGDHRVSLDGGCGFGGPLVCGLFDAAGDLLEVIEA